MQINKILSGAATNLSRKAGQALLNTQPSGQKTASMMRAVNNFVQGEGINPGRGAYYTLISVFVLIPRLLRVREPDEFREVLTRDITSVLTILFAMNALKSGMCTKAQKDSGLVLVKDTIGQEASKFKRALGYLNPEGGIQALAKDEITARYSHITDKDSFINMLTSIDNNGGNIAKTFTIEKRPEGLLERAKRFIKGDKTPKETPLYNAAKKMFGTDFEEQTNTELIDRVRKITEEKVEKAQGLREIIGNRAFEHVDHKSLKVVIDDHSGILNGDKNPLTQYAKNVSANFDTLSLALTAAFLGFGLPKFNETLTKRKHLNKPAVNMNRASRPYVAGNTDNVLYSSIKRSTKTASAFHKFV